ncbi:unnamed protein product [Calypogeia fissa]
MEMEEEKGDQVVQWGLAGHTDLANDLIPSKHGDDEGKAFTLPPAPSARNQLKAMLWRQWLFKRRGTGQTFMELISPILMLSLLVLGWTRTTLDHYDAEVFANASLPVMEEFSGAVLGSKHLLQNCPPAVLLEQQLTARELELLAGLVRSQLSQDLGQFSGLNLSLNSTLNDLLPPTQEPDPTLLTPELFLLSLKCVNTAQEALRALRVLSKYNGPLPIPSFDGFVTLHKLVRKGLESQEGQLERSVHLQKKFGNILGNLLELGQIAFAPNTSEVTDLVNHMLAEHQYFKGLYGGTFNSEKEAIDSSMKGTGSPLWAVVYVKNLDVSGGNVDYIIRMNYTTVPKTTRAVHRYSHGLVDRYKHYYTSGFLSIQHAINSYVLKEFPTTSPEGMFINETVWGAPFPVGEYTHNRFYDAVGPLMGLVMCLSTLYPLAMLVKALVEEKETRAKETMRIMGLKPWVFSLSWFATYMVVFFIVSVFVTSLLKVTFFPKSDASIIFILFFLFTSSLIPFGFFLSVFFSKAKLAALVAPFVHFASIMPRYVFFRTGSGQALPGKSATSLLPPTAFTFGVDLMAQYEGADVGLTWANIREDEFSLAWIFFLFIVDCLLYGLLAWYLEQVLPSQYGARLSPWFFLKSSYWYSDIKYRADYELVTEMEDPCWQNEVEPVGGGNFVAAVQVKDLKKVFPGGKVAVDGLNLTIYQDQITALLGHNGAGKSTTISMLTGLIRPTGGDANIWGHSIRGDLSSIRRTIGVCPQQNVLFQNLTVNEHLELYAAVKGIPDKLVAQEAQEMVDRLGLSDKTNAPASSLSGGMKRKLQVAIAMLGGSRIVFLDEPTSGMDPHARRAMWELLRTFKQGRAIVLTTHYMDEADLLCDRIAIMSDGRLRCCGSSLYLKAKYGVGYNLTMTKSSSACSEAAVQEVIFNRLPQAVPLSSAGGEMAFQLPVANKAAFAELFEELEQQKDALKIGGYGVSMTTLEEVFIRLANEDTTPVAQMKSSHPESHRHDELDLLPPTELESGAGDGETDPLFSIYEKGSFVLEDEDVEAAFAARRMVTVESCSFFTAWFEMLKKRAIIARRDLKGLINTILLPVAVIAFVMMILKLNIDPVGPALPLEFDMFKKSLETPHKAQGNLTIPVAGVAISTLPFIGESDFVELQAAQGILDSVQMSENLLATIQGLPRYGALVFNDTLLPQYNTSVFRDVNITDLKFMFPNSTFLQGLQDGLVGDLPFMQTPDGQGVKSPLTLLHNTSSEHALPVLIQEIAQASLRAALNLSTASFRVQNHPLPLTKSEASRLQTMLYLLAALFVLIPFCYLAASFSVFIVRERVVKAKLLQMLSGANTYSYWAATYSWDMMNYIAIVAITMLVFVAYRDQAFIGSWTKAGAVLVLLICFGLSVLPLSYCYSFAFSSHANAQVAIAGIHFVTGFVMLVASTVMGALRETKEMNKWLVHVWQFFPTYNLGKGLLSLSALDLQTTFRGGKAHPYQWDILGRPLSLMLLEAVGYMILTLIIDDDWLSYIYNLVWDYARNYLARRRSPTAAWWHAASSNGESGRAEDVDVTNEKRRIESGLADGDAVKVQNLWKIYPGQGVEPAKVAVRDLCLGIPSGECFGFLGVNGAGKTTTLSILSGDIKPTSGIAFINGHSVVTDLQGVRKHIGYCPQFDPLLDLMTGREHLQMYARLKGVPRRRVRNTADEVLKAVGLQKYADTVAGVYSGGNKRKLALAIALVGDPAVVFLDEPSSGMDPVARRSMWDVIVDAITERNVSMVLTTHSMEECEALCGRVGVMVAGSLMCLGSIQHLKSRFGNGYNVELQCKRPENLQQIHGMITEFFPGATLDEQHSLRVKYSIPLEGLSLSKVFRTIESEKERIGLEDYSVSQSSLEQIFISFAKGRDHSCENDQ